MKWFIVCLKKYATFSGRARRKEYWMFTLFSLIVSILMSVLDLSVGTYDVETGNGVFGLIYTLGILLPSIAVAVRRMHDVGKSGWYILIPIYNFILSVTEGDKGDNEYGPDPKSSESFSGDLLDSHI